MSLIIDLTPSQEARLSAVAERTGLAPAEWVKKLLEEHWPVVPAGGADQNGARERQEPDEAAPKPDESIQSMFAKWAEEDANMTFEEREAEDRLWEELEVALTQNRGLQLRRLT